MHMCTIYCKYVLSEPIRQFSDGGDGHLGYAFSETRIYFSIQWVSNNGNHIQRNCLQRGKYMVNIYVSQYFFSSSNYRYFVVILVYKIRIYLLMEFYMTRCYKDVFPDRLHSFENFSVCFKVAAILDLGFKNTLQYPMYVTKRNPIQISFQKRNYVILCFAIVRFYEFCAFLRRPSWIWGLEWNIIMQ